MGDARIFGYAASERLLEMMASLPCVALARHSPWEGSHPEGPFDCCLVEVSPGREMVAQSWISSLRVRFPGARIHALVHGDVASDLADEVRGRVDGVIAHDAPADDLERLCSSVGRLEPLEPGVGLTDEERLAIARVAMQGTNQAFFLIQDGIILDATLPGHRSRAFSLERTLGRHFLEFLHPSSREKVARTYLRRMSGENVPQRYEAIAVGPDSEPFPVELVVHSFGFRGRPAAVGTLTEITDRHAWLSIRDRRERELSLVNEVTHLLISGRSLDNSVIRALEAILDALDADGGGVFSTLKSSRGPFTPMVTRKRVHGSSRSWRGSNLEPITLHPQALASLRAGSTVTGPPCIEAEGMGEHHVSAPLMSKKKLTGFVHIFRQRGEPFDDEEGSLLESIAAALAMGVENRRLYEDLSCSYQELLSTQKQLLRRERLAVIGNMAAHVAHEIRNPVATIMNASGQIRKRVELTGVEAELSDIIQEELERLRRLCDDLVMFSRTPRPAPRLVRLDGFIEEIVSDLAKAQFITSEMQAGVTVEPPDLEVHQDPDILHQLLHNLLLNGIQSMGGKGRLDVRARIEKRRLLIDVTDSGPGIPPEIIDRIFDPFFTTHPESSGLGLAIVRNYVEEMGGELTVTSAAGQGTTIHLILALDRPSQPPLEGL